MTATLLPPTFPLSFLHSDVRELADSSDSKASLPKMVFPAELFPAPVFPIRTILHSLEPAHKYTQHFTSVWELMGSEETHRRHEAKTRTLSTHVRERKRQCLAQPAQTRDPSEHTQHAQGGDIEQIRAFPFLYLWLEQLLMFSTAFLSE